jgi:acyl carrier protein
MTVGIERVLAVIERVAGPDRTPPDAGPGTRLADGGFWLDSVHLLEAVVACEGAFEIVFDPETDFMGETLRTVGTLHALIRSRGPAEA